MSRLITSFHEQGVSLLTIPDAYSKPGQWSAKLLSSARGEIDYVLTQPRLGKYTIEALEKLRREIEQEMRKRLAVESPAEFTMRCLFHESAIDYSTGERDGREKHIAGYRKRRIAA